MTEKEPESKIQPPEGMISPEVLETPDAELINPELETDSLDQLMNDLRGELEELEEV